MPSPSRSASFWIALAALLVVLLSWSLFVGPSMDERGEKVNGLDSSQVHPSTADLPTKPPHDGATPASRIALAEEPQRRATSPSAVGELADFRGAIQLVSPGGPVTERLDGEVMFNDGRRVSVYAGEFTISERIGATRDVETISLGAYYALPREARVTFDDPADVITVVADVEMLGELTVRSSLDLPISDVSIAFSSSSSHYGYPTNVEHRWTGLTTPTRIPKFRYWTRGQVFWVSAQGHGWKRLEHPGDATPRTIVLDRAGELAIEVRGENACAELGEIRIEGEGETVTELTPRHGNSIDSVVLTRFPVGEFVVQTLLRKRNEAWETNRQEIEIEKGLEAHLRVDLCSVETTPAFARLDVEIDLRNWLGDPAPVLSIQPVSTSMNPRGGGVFALAQWEEGNEKGTYRWRSDRMEPGEWRVTLTSTEFNELVSLDPGAPQRLHWEPSSEARLDVVLKDEATGAPLTDGFIEWLPTGASESLSIRWQSSPGTYTLVGSPRESVDVAAYHSGFVPSVQFGVSTPNGATQVVMRLRRAPKIEISLVDEVGGQFVFNRWGEIVVEGPGHVVSTETSSTNGAGWAMLEVDQPGIYRIRLPELPGRTSDPQEVSAAAGEVTKVHIVLRPAN